MLYTFDILFWLNPYSHKIHRGSLLEQQDLILLLIQEHQIEDDAFALDPEKGIELCAPPIQKGFLPLFDDLLHRACFDINIIY